MSQSVTECHRVSQSVTESHRVSQSVTECHRVLQAVTGCHRVSQSVIECYRVSQSVTESQRVSQRVTECHRVSQSVDSVVKVTIDHTSESKQDVIQASQKLLHFLSKTTSSNSIVKKHKGKKYCCIAREKHFDSSNVTSSLNVCVEMLAK